MAQESHKEVANKLAESELFDCENIRSNSRIGVEVTPDIGQYEVSRLKDSGYTLCYTSTTRETGKYARVLVFKRYSDA